MASDHSNSDMLDPLSMRKCTGYMPLEHYGLIGNMRTAALVAMDGGIDCMCWPDFDSPSLFARILDRQKGGYFCISPQHGIQLNVKQRYVPCTNILHTNFYAEEGALRLTDFFPRPIDCRPLEMLSNRRQFENKPDPRQVVKKWLVRRVEATRGEVDVNVNICPAFNYARDDHSVDIMRGSRSLSGNRYETAVFRSKALSLAVQVCCDSLNKEDTIPPKVTLELFRDSNALGAGVYARLRLKAGQRVSFIMHEHDPENSCIEEYVTPELLDHLQEETRQYWCNWIRKSQYSGRWQEVIERSLLTLKLLVYEPTGAIVAAPTFSLPESVGGNRNWDYRYCWVRDASFTVYILLRLGFNEEAEAYMSFIADRFHGDRTSDGGLPIMFSIHGETNLPEQELDHLEGYRQSRPVRIGNGAASHKQLDIYGELMDAVYLYNKYAKPISHDDWLAMREIVDHVCTVWNQQDMSIWEVRGQVQHFVYSKIMMWVCVDRAVRLADKRGFPCPQKSHWMETKDRIMEDVHALGYNKEMQCFAQSYEHGKTLDAALLIAPLVFFIAPNDPRFLKTLERILLPTHEGGLTSDGMVYRYNSAETDDGLGGTDEGAFSMCTFWLIEALTRAGSYDQKYLDRALFMLENTLAFGNHVGIFSEEIGKTGEQLGNTPQAFSHLSMISAAFNLDRVMKGYRSV